MAELLCGQLLGGRDLLTLKLTLTLAHQHLRVAEFLGGQHAHLGAPRLAHVAGAQQPALDARLHRVVDRLLQAPAPAANNLGFGIQGSGFRVTGVRYGL